MSVATELGLGEGLRSASLLAASGCWAGWAAADTSLAGPTGVAELVDWLRSAEPGEADRVLHALVRLGSASGGDDLVAVDVVAWALLPGARVLAHRLRGVSPHVDELVAAQLWLEVRTFPWLRLRKVAANVLANTRAQILAVEAPLPEMGPRGRGAVVRLVDPHDLWWQQRSAPSDQASRDAAVELREVLGDAGRCGVLEAADCVLLEVLLEQADLAGGGARRGRGGLLAERVVDGVVVVTGLSPATVRRRVRRSVVAIADARTRFSA